MNNLQIRHHCLFVCECKNAPRKEEEEERKREKCEEGTEDLSKNMHRSPSGWKERLSKKSSYKILL